VQSFDIVGQGHSNPNMSELILAIKGEVEAGGTFAQALKNHPLYFDDLFCSLVEAGEQSGALETLLEKVATYKEKTEALKKKIKGALTYPISVLVVAFIVTAILLLYVVPIFADMFQDFGADLPAFTAFVVSLSDAFIEQWYFIVGGIIGTFLGITNSYKRSRKFREWFDRVTLKLPVTADLVMKSSVARFSRTADPFFHRPHAAR